MIQPSANGANGGRDNRGRFAAGNRGGPGNPHSRRVGQLRSAILEAISSEDIAEIFVGLSTAAKAGDVAAAKLVLSYSVGEPRSFNVAGLEKVNDEGSSFIETAYVSGSEKVRAAVLVLAEYQAELLS
jgi:hypothetical protein